MTTKEIADKYHISKKKAIQMAEKLGYVKVKGKWEFPNDFIPLYIPDGRKYKTLTKSPIFPYIYVMDAISLMYRVEDNYMGLINNQVLKTTVRELRNSGLIILKDGANKKSLNYRDYVVSLKAGDWFERPINDRKKFLFELVSTIAAGTSYGIVSSLN